MTFGEKLQKLRRTAGMSQEQLAEQLEVSRQAVSKWELGDSLPDAARILTLSRKFGVSADYLLKDELEEPAVSSLTGSGQAKEEGAEKSCAFLPPAPSAVKEKARHRLADHRSGYRRSGRTGLFGGRDPVQHDRIPGGYHLSGKRNHLVHQRTRVLLYRICRKIPAGGSFVGVWDADRGGVGLSLDMVGKAVE